MGATSVCYSHGHCLIVVVVDLVDLLLVSVAGYIAVLVALFVASRRPSELVAPLGFVLKASS